MEETPAYSLHIRLTTTSDPGVSLDRATVGGGLFLDRVQLREEAKRDKLTKSCFFNTVIYRVS